MAEDRTFGRREKGPKNCVFDAGIFQTACNRPPILGHLPTSALKHRQNKASFSSISPVTLDKPHQLLVDDQPEPTSGSNQTQAHTHTHTSFPRSPAHFPSLQPSFQSINLPTSPQNISHTSPAIQRTPSYMMTVKPPTATKTARLATTACFHVTPPDSTECQPRR